MVGWLVGWQADRWKLNKIQSLGEGALDEAEAVRGIPGEGRRLRAQTATAAWLKYGGRWSPLRLSISASHVNARCSTYHSTYYNLIKTGAEGPS